MVILCGVVAVIGYPVAKVYRVTWIKNHFAEIHQGQTKHEVLQILGSPDETTGCTSDNRECVETFWYYGFIECWMVYFDRDGRVIDGGYNVSP